MSITLTNARTRIVPQMNRVGPSTPTAPSAATWPGLPWANRLDEAAITIVITNAAASPPSASAMWISRRRRRGTNASTSVPATATPKTSSIGSSWPYSMCGGVMAAVRPR